VFHIVKHRHTFHFVKDSHTVTRVPRVAIAPAARYWQRLLSSDRSAGRKSQ
jgi:hypothetical protein